MRQENEDVLPGFTVKCKSACGNFYITFNYARGMIVEVWVELGKSGACEHAIGKSLSGSITMLLGKGALITEIGLLYMNTQCHKISINSPCCIDTVGRKLMAFGEIEHIECLYPALELWSYILHKWYEKSGTAIVVDRKFSENILAE